MYITWQSCQKIGSDMAEKAGWQKGKEKLGVKRNGHSLLHRGDHND